MIILGNINTSSSSNGLAKFPQIINKLDQIAPRKKNTCVAIICHFLIKNYPAHTQKRAHQRICYLKKRSYQNKRLLNHKDIAGNKQFWRTSQQLLSDKSKSNEKITIEDNKIINNM